MFGLTLETNRLMDMNHNWARYAKLACNYLGKIELCAEYGSMDNYYNLSHYVPLSPMFCPTQGYPLRFLALIHMYALPTRFQERFHQGPLVDALPYMFLILKLRPLWCIIGPQHQPLINPNSSKNTKLAMT
jgi:hypothetical protein